jgi:hypothetical protein
MRSVLLLVLILRLTTSALAQKVDEAQAIREINELNSRIAALVRQDELRKALELALAAKKIADENLPQFHEVTVATLSNVAEIQYRRKATKEAEELFAKLVVARETIHGPDHSALIVPLERLASVMVERNETEPAKAILLRALTLREKTFGKEDPSSVSAKANLGSVYIKHNEFEAGETLLLEALSASDKIAGNTSDMSYSIADDYLHSVSQRKGKEETREILTALAEKRGVLVLRSDMMLEQVEKKASPSVAYGGQDVVNILVIADETGRVISAKSPIPFKNQKAWEEAAMRSTFRPVRINGKPIKLMGRLMFFP